MLGNGSSERYKLSYVLQRQVTITFRLVPPATPRAGWSKNIRVYQRMLLGAGSWYLAGNKVWAVKGWPWGEVTSTWGYCWKGGFCRGCHNLFLNFFANCEITFPPPHVLCNQVRNIRYTSVLVPLQDFIVSQDLGDKVGPSGWDPVLHWVYQNMFYIGEFLHKGASAGCLWRAILKPRPLVEGNIWRMLSEESFGFGCVFTVTLT